MGTNFQWVGPPDRKGNWTAGHIGKRSGAGGGLCSFGMQAHHDLFETPLWSWRQWRALILLPGAHVYDEYQAEHDPVTFVAEVERTTTENRARQWQWMVDHGHPFIPADPPLTRAPEREDRRDWLCPDGFSFTYARFT